MSCEWVCRLAWLGVEAFDFCTCLYVCIASAVCDFLISAVWRKLTNKGCASSSVWDWVKREVKLLKCWNRLLVIRAWAVAGLLSGLYVSRMAELRLLMTIDQVGQARQQTPQNYMAPLIFNIGTVYMWAVNITPLSLCPQKLPRSPLNRRVAVPQSGSGRSGEEKMSFPF